MAIIYDERPAPLGARRISWAAIFAGLALALAIQVVLSLLGIAIGASAVRPTDPNAASAQAVGIGSSVWFVISAMIAVFAGAWTTARLTGIPKYADAIVHGLITWSLTIFVTLYLLTTAVGSILGGASNALGSLMSAASVGISAAAPGIVSAAGSQLTGDNGDGSSVVSKVQTLVAETSDSKLKAKNLASEAKHQANLVKHAMRHNALHPAATHSTNNEVYYRFLHETPGASRVEDRRDLINIVAKEQHITHYQAAQIVDGWLDGITTAKKQAESTAKAAAQKAKQLADETAAAVAKAALLAFLAFVGGAVAAIAGAYTSTRTLMRVVIIPSVTITTGISNEL